MLNRVFTFFIVINNLKINSSRPKTIKVKKTYLYTLFIANNFHHKYEQPLSKEYHFLIIYQPVSKTILDSGC